MCFVHDKGMQILCDDVHFKKTVEKKFWKDSSFSFHKIFVILGLGSIAGIAPIETLGGGLDSTDLPGVSDIPIPESTVEQVRLRNILRLGAREWYDMATSYSKLFSIFFPLLQQNTNFIFILNLSAGLTWITNFDFPNF